MLPRNSVALAAGSAGDTVGAACHDAIPPEGARAGGVESAMDDGWYEDFAVGTVFRTPGKTLSEAEILQWGFAYDPQPFHMDRVAAERSVYGGLIASGWQLGTLAFRLFTALRPFAPEASLGSPGVDELRWRAPVRPGDTLRVVVTVVDRRISRSDPERGIVQMEWEMHNQREEVVLTMRGPIFVRPRPAEGGRNAGTGPG